MVLKSVPQLHEKGFWKVDLRQQDWIKKLFLTQKMMNKCLALYKKYRSWTVNDWKKLDHQATVSHLRLREGCSGQRIKKDVRERVKEAILNIKA
ncbi:hypothetical protein TNCV_1692141 [Trichonephila clavipes]|nr:hypothetical protein TNCV_1692141 [Trichonephila clavipes]